MAPENCSLLQAIRDNGCRQNVEKSKEYHDETRNRAFLAADLMGLGDAGPMCSRAKERAARESRAHGQPVEKHLADRSTADAGEGDEHGGEAVSSTKVWSDGKV